jgi:hypothetical protein
MNKYIISVEETIVLRHEITIETDKNIDEVDSILNKVQKKATTRDEVQMFLPEYDCNVIEFCEDGSGDIKIEIDDLYGIE